ncbi:hypothetical protein GCM10009563_11040 [Subtercola frigoramans]
MTASFASTSIAIPAVTLESDAETLALSPEATGVSGSSCSVFCVAVGVGGEVRVGAAVALALCVAAVATPSAADAHDVSANAKTSDTMAPATTKTRGGRPILFVTVPPM